MGEFDIGNSVPRTEDPRLLSGGGRYVDDIDLPGLCRAHILRSPHAHAAIRAIDADEARAMPGVHAVLTGVDYAASGLGTIQAQLVLKARDGTPMIRPPFAPLAIDRAVHVGEAVAVVVADTLAQAKDAAETIHVDFEPLEANIDTALADTGSVPPLWEESPDNESFVHLLGDRDAVEAGFAQAAHVVERRFVISRVTSNTMEPRAFVGDVDRSGRHTLYAACHYPHRLRSGLAKDIFRLPENRVRVIANDVGGSFGLRGGMYPEQILVLWASREVGRPVKWTCERSEGLISDHQGRDNVTDAALALDEAGNFLAMRVRTRVNIGAYVASMAGGPATANLGTLAGTYVTPAIHVETAGVFTNTNSTCPYRGAGRPEAAYVIEQLIDAAARELGRDAVELRRQNTIPEDAMPFRTGLVFNYDCGAFEKNLDRALEIADHAAFEERRAESKASGKLRGIGISNTIERAGAPSQERACCASIPRARRRCSSAPSATARGTRRSTSRSSPRRSASIRRRCGWLRATRTRSRSAGAPADRDRRRSAARRCCARPRRSSNRQDRSRLIFWRRPRRMSSSPMALSGSPVPTVRSRSSRSRGPPTCP